MKIPIFIALALCGPLQTKANDHSAASMHALQPETQLRELKYQHGGDGTTPEGNAG
jgi:hypothetical protein